MKAGTLRAKEIREKWVQRQQELKEAMASIVKPAEHMAKLAQILNNRTNPNTVIASTLLELESLVTDIDNARDFHTIGGWSILLELLDDSISKEIITNIAWVIGTIVKNDYDHQLWVLETMNTTSNEMTIRRNSTVSFTCLQMLVQLLHYSSNTSEDEPLQRRVLYAISSAARGNPDIQEALQHTFPTLHKTNNISFAMDSINDTYYHNISFLSTIYTLAMNPYTSIEVQRKIWAFISDMLGERRYVRQDLLQQLPSDSTEELKNKVLEDIKQLNLLGDLFCEVSWINLAKSRLDELTIIINSNKEYNNNILINDNDNNSNNIKIKENEKGYISLINNLLTTLTEVARQCPDLLNAGDLIPLKSRIWKDLGWLEGYNHNNDNNDDNNNLLSTESNDTMINISHMEL